MSGADQIATAPDTAAGFPDENLAKLPSPKKTMKGSSAKKTYDIQDTYLSSEEPQRLYSFVTYLYCMYLYYYIFIYNITKLNKNVDDKDF